MNKTMYVEIKGNDVEVNYKNDGYGIQNAYAVIYGDRHEIDTFKRIDTEEELEKIVVDRFSNWFYDVDNFKQAINGLSIIEIEELVEDHFEVYDIEICYDNVHALQKWAKPAQRNSKEYYNYFLTQIVTIKFEGEFVWEKEIHADIYETESDAYNTFNNQEWADNHSDIIEAVANAIVEIEVK